MRGWSGFVLRLGLSGLVFVACSESGSDPGPLEGIHPQPQPNNGDQKFTAPCSAASCGAPPSSLTSPRCKPVEMGCGWAEDSSVSYRQCADEDCGIRPTADVCAEGTTFRGAACGSENEAVCSWSTVCAPPPSTTPCATADGCGGKPMLGVICKDGSTGDLECMQFAVRCSWQRTCE